MPPLAHLTGRSQYAPRAEQERISHRQRTESTQLGWAGRLKGELKTLPAALLGAFTAEGGTANRLGPGLNPICIFVTEAKVVVEPSDGAAATLFSQILYGFFEGHGILGRA